MAEGAVGRELLLKKNGVVIAGLRTKSFSWGGESIDVTSGENNGVRCLLEASGQEQIDITADGITKDNTLKNIALTIGQDKMLTDIEIEWPIFVDGNTTAATLTGNFRMSAYEESSPYNDAITFSFTLESSGPWVFTAEAA